MLVSQCSKQALVESRRILDQFAERKGERTWQTLITMQGLITLRKILRKSARRNTAIACHWIKSGNHAELLWIVGNQQKFNEQGTVPTNITRRNILRTQSENQWHTAEVIALLAGIAGLFHDFGKANKLFQQKLKPAYHGKLSEPYRHDWLSLRMFQAFVAGMSDQQWLEKLSVTSEIDEPGMLAALDRDGLDKGGNPFSSLRQPLARAIGWLILSHHRLPKWDKTQDGANAPRLSQIDNWLESSKFGPAWNSPQSCNALWTVKELAAVWQFSDGSPLHSGTWRAKAHSIATRALKQSSLVSEDTDWMADAFTLHLARMLLMLADHHYSAQESTPAWQDKQFKPVANTDRETRQPKQKLDEHLVGVGYNALLLARGLPSFRQTLPAITRHKGFTKRSEGLRYRWQDKSYELAYGLRERASEQGFFGVNMASTGCGKTFANGRIMYGLAKEKSGCRFSVALGLRTLTLQTGDALRERLMLDEDDIAVLIGSQAVRQLHEYHGSSDSITGSESAEELLEESQHVRYEGALDDSRIGQWLRKTPKLHQLISAPILVSTIDHLIPATESERGGSHIVPMLRLLTSDLVLDEPDDFDLADLPALARLVNWAGLLGSRVLISSATLPPVLVRALFDAYRTGRRNFQNSCGERGRAQHVCCAWFDEYGVEQSDHAEPTTFGEAHDRFVKKRVAALSKAVSVRHARLLPVSAEQATAAEAVTAITSAAHAAMPGLHAAHCQIHPETGKRISVGLIRMANINQLVAVARLLFATPSDKGFRIHYCVYHSQHPLAVRSDMEKRLDSVLNRHDPMAIWRQESILQVMTSCPEENQLFVVLATPVAEVGRDHDYDWAIAEPSSMRSLIQLAGRIQRHRDQSSTADNLLILSHNYKALIGRNVAFTSPGFESAQFLLKTHDLHDLLETEQFKTINALPRIQERKSLHADQNLADLEHVTLNACLFGAEQQGITEHAALWWQHAAHWSYELQRRSMFRNSAPDSEYLLYMESEREEPLFCEVDVNGELKRCEKLFERIELQQADGVSLWGNNDIAGTTVQLADSMDMEIDWASRRFAVFRLRKTEQRWLYSSALGVFGDLT